MRLPSSSGSKNFIALQSKLIRCFCLVCKGVDCSPAGIIIFSKKSSDTFTLRWYSRPRKLTSSSSTSSRRSFSDSWVGSNWICSGLMEASQPADQPANLSQQFLTQILHPNPARQQASQVIWVNSNPPCQPSQPAGQLADLNQTNLTPILRT